MTVSPHYDSMLGKLIAHAPTRGEAIDVLISALGTMQLLGLPTNRAFLAACLDHPQFRSGQALIPFLEEQGSGIRALLQKREQTIRVDAGLQAFFPLKTDKKAVLGSSMACPFPRPLRFCHRGEIVELRVRETRDGALEVESGGERCEMRAAPAAIVVLHDGRRHVQLGAVDLFVTDASFEPANANVGAGAATELRAPFNGKVIAVKVSAGSAVAQGDTLLVIESMKLEHAVAAKRAGVVKSIHVAAGQQAATAQVLVTFEASA